jgi:hypothetical protein
MSLKGRIDRLEKDHGGGDELPYLPIRQSLTDPDLFYNDEKKIAVRKGTPEWAELHATHEIVAIEYIRDWRGDEPKR